MVERVRMVAAGGRGESYADGARRVGQVAGVVIPPDASDMDVYNAQNQALGTALANFNDASIGAALVNVLGGLTNPLTIGDDDADGETAAIPPLIICAKPFPKVGATNRVSLRLATGGAALIALLAPSGEVIGISPIAGLAGRRTYDIAPLAGPAGSRIGFLSGGAAQLRYDPARGAVYVRAENPGAIAVGQVLFVTETEQSVLPAISYEFRTAQRLVSALQASTAVWAFIALGQSNAAGTTPINPQALTLPHGDGQVRMLNGGVRVIRGDYDDTALVQDSQIAALVPAGAKVEGGGPPSGQHYGETPLEAMAYKLAAQLGIRVVIASLAVGGKTLAQLGPGTKPWANLQKVAYRIKDLLAAEGSPCIFAGIIGHGESEEGATRQTYKAHGNVYLDAVSSLFRTVSGQADVPFIAWQPGGLLNPSEVPVAWKELSDERQDLFLMSALHGIPKVDQHYTSPGNHYIGELAAETFREYYNGGALDGGSHPVHIISATTAGSYLDVQFGGMKVGPEIEGSDSVPPLPGWGLDLFDDTGNPPVVTNAQPSLVAGYPDRVRFALSAPWNATGRRVRSAYRQPGTGNLGDPSFYQRTNIRDAMPIGSNLDGTLLYRRLVACDVPVS